jgi:hypothetical protein
VVVNRKAGKVVGLNIEAVAVDKPLEVEDSRWLLALPEPPESKWAER